MWGLISFQFITKYNYEVKQKCVCFKYFKMTCF